MTLRHVFKKLVEQGVTTYRALPFSFRGNTQENHEIVLQ